MKPRLLTLPLLVFVLTAVVLTAAAAIAAAEPSPPDPIKVEGDVTPPRALHKEAPAYPEEARKAKTEGVVVVQAIIDAQGEVTGVQVLRDAPDGLSEAAVEAVRQWRFEPALLDGEPVAVYYNLTINFRLDGDEKEGDKREG